MPQHRHMIDSSLRGGQDTCGTHHKTKATTVLGENDLTPTKTLPFRNQHVPGSSSGDNSHSRLRSCMTPDLRVRLADSTSMSIVYVVQLVHGPHRSGVRCLGLELLISTPSFRAMAIIATPCAFRLMTSSESSTSGSPPATGCFVRQSSSSLKPPFSDNDMTCRASITTDLRPA